VLDNNFALLRALDTRPARNASDSSLALRVRFVYVHGLGPGAAHVHAAGYALEMQPLQDTPLAVLVQSECSALGFGAPHSHLAPALGGSLLHNVIVNDLGARPSTCARGSACRCSSRCRGTRRRCTSTPAATQHPRAAQPPARACARRPTSTLSRSSSLAS